MEDHSLLANLAVTMGIAVLGGLLAVRLKQSIILGYLLAGIAIGPFTPGFVGDAHAVQNLADLGVIFLMFAVGMELSPADLRRLGLVAGLGTCVQVAAITGAGYLIGMALGWGTVESIFFGAIVSISSGTVLSKILEERGALASDYGRLGLAWSVWQDVITIVLVLVLGSLANDGNGADLLPTLLLALGRAAIFLAVLLPLGTRVLPWLFLRIAAYHSRELFLLSIAAVAMGTAYAAGFFGLSAALGAFVAGVAVSESDISHEVLGQLLPVRDILAALFFISVGMLFDPLFVFGHWPQVVLAATLIIAAKGVLIGGIVAVGRYPMRTAVLTGVGLAQSGEFSFILARFGSDLGAVSHPVFSTI